MSRGQRSNTIRVSAVALTACLALALLAGETRPSSAGAATANPPVRHVFVIVLENQNYSTTFGPGSAAPYLATTLAHRGQLLTQYYGTGHASLDNYITMVSGQSANPDTQGDCVYYTNVLPGTIGPGGQAIGQGCAYPHAVRTIANQLTAHDLRWRGYMEDMGSDPSREAARCAHPQLGSTDPTQTATARDQYANRHNPFAYFHSIIDHREDCAHHVVPLRLLTSDLRSASTTRNLSFITPDLCHDGHDATCVNAQQKGGLPGVDEFLRVWAPRILQSDAFRRDGLLVITFDESEDDASSCCFTPTGPNTPMQGIYGPGGGRTGTVLISPWIKPGSRNTHPYNHYSLLRSLEDLFHLSHIGYAANSAVTPFGGDVFRASRNG
jgi:phosphatidylinositol-3-phosphatase